MRLAPKIGVMGVSGSSMASGIGTIRFIIADDDGRKHTIILNDVIYLPELANNLISTSKWSDDKDNNCGIPSQRRYSIFMWDHDSKQKHITHPPNYQIPPMPVNRFNEVFVLFNSTHSSQFSENWLLISNGVYIPRPDLDREPATSHWYTATDQHSVNVHQGMDPHMYQLGPPSSTPKINANK